MLSLGLPGAEVTEYCLRILLACLLGAAIGLERSHRFKEAGTRTHLIVCATAALLMIVSKYAFGDIHEGAKAADSARIAAQVVSGVSFLCAGVIFRIGVNIKGLTTAAGLWMTAAIGLTCGAGLYVISIFTVALVMLAQYLLHHFPFGNESVTNYSVLVVLKDGHPFEDFVQKVLGLTGGSYELLGVHSERGGIEYSFNIRSRGQVKESDWAKLISESEEILQFNVKILN